MKKLLKYLLWSFICLLSLIIIFFIVMYFITMGDYQVAKTVAQDSYIPHIEVDGIVFHAEDFGKDTNQTVIVIHGGPGNDYRYLLPLKDLSQNYHVVFYDQRGTGLSPRVDESELTAENALEDLGRIIQYYSPNEKVSLIGHSWGGMLASGYTAQNPERIDKLILAEPGMLTTKKAKEFNDAFQFEASWPAIKAIVRIIFESFHVEKIDNQAQIDYIFNEVPALNMEGNPMRKYFCNEDLKNAYIPYWRMSGKSSLSIVESASNERGELELDLVSGIENFKGKTWFIIGECNQIIGESYQMDHMKYFPNAEMIVMKNAGHSMFGEKPIESIEILENCLQTQN